MKSVLSFLIVFSVGAGTAYGIDQNGKDGKDDAKTFQTLGSYNGIQYTFRTKVESIDSGHNSGNVTVRAVSKDQKIDVSDDLFLEDEGFDNNPEVSFQDGVIKVRFFAEVRSASGDDEKENYDHCFRFFAVKKSFQSTRCIQHRSSKEKS